MKSIVFLFDYVHLLYYKCHKKDPQGITIKPLINKHNWEGINFPSEKDIIGKYLRKIMQQLTLVFCMLKKEKILPALVSKQLKS